MTDSNTTQRLPFRPVAAAPPLSGDEAALVLAAKADLAQFEPLYLLYVDPVYRYCFRRLSNPTDAADATSQVFIKAISSLSSCRPESFRSWLFAIAHNVLVDWFRQRRPESSLSEGIEHPSRGPSPEDLALAADDKRLVQTLLEALTADQRAVVELRLAGLNGNEIAAALGRSRASVDTAQSRAVSRLRALLAAAPSTEESKGLHDAIA